MRSDKKKSAPKRKAIKTERSGMKINQTVLYDAKPRQLEAPRRELGRPELPPGVIPKDHVEMAMDDAGQSLPWGWSNQMAGWGCGLFFPGYPYLAELSQRPEYRSPVETIAEEMTRKWIEFKSTGTEDVSDKIEQIENAFAEFGIQDKFRHATEKDNYFGRAQMYVDIKGHENKRDLPLLIDKATIPKGSLKSFKVIEPMWTTPVVWNSLDPTADDFYKPSM